MGEIVNDLTTSPGSVEFISGYRSGNQSGERPKYTCDVKVTAFDPFDFVIDWRTKYVKVRKSKVTKSGRKFYYYTTLPVPYPYYEFVLKTRTVREWRFELKAGKSVLAKLHERFPRPHILRNMAFLEARLKRYGPCRVIKPRSASVQHDVVHWSSDISEVPTEGVLMNAPGAFAYTLAQNGHYGHRAFELESEYVGDAGTGPFFIANASLENPLNTAKSVVFSDTTVSTVTAMLWPDSGDMEDIGSSPLIDLAEAASDGVFPLGPPPNPVDAHARMVRSALSDDTFATIAKVVDFAADAYLWTTLVFEPVIQSAIGLSVAVEANDIAIDRYAELAAGGKWHQGKSIRLFGLNPTMTKSCLGIPDKLSYDNNELGCTRNVTHTIDAKSIEANALFVYKLSEFDAAQMNTSAMRLGQFFNRLSSSLDTVIHNIIPLSFVYDWFTSEYTGILNLKDKVYLPVDDWKVTISLKTDIDVETVCTTTTHAYTNKRIVCVKYKECPYPGTVPDIQSGVGPAPYDASYQKISWINSTYYYVQYDWETVETEAYVETQETHKYYQRSVFDRPVRRTDFSDGEVGIECLDTTKSDPLEETGKLVTLGALLWGFTR